MAKKAAVLDEVIPAFTRADLIKTAIIDGLKQLGENQRAAIIEGVQFDYDPFRGRVMAYCPRRHSELNQPATVDMVKYLEEVIEMGLKVHGFMDCVFVEP